MKALWMMDLYIKKNSKGRGVYSGMPIYSGDLIESCEMIVIPNDQIGDTSKLAYYCFIWDEDCALALGYGSLYNHSYKPNAKYERDFKNNKMNFYAIKDIKSGKEITINYNYISDCKDPVEFYKG